MQRRAFHVPWLRRYRVVRIHSSIPREQSFPRARAEKGRAAHYATLTIPFSQNRGRGTSRSNSSAKLHRPTFNARSHVPSAEQFDRGSGGLAGTRWSPQALIVLPLPFRPACETVLLAGPDASSGDGCPHVQSRHLLRTGQSGAFADKHWYGPETPPTSMRRVRARARPVPLSAPVWPFLFSLPYRLAPLRGRTSTPPSPRDEDKQGTRDKHHTDSRQRPPTAPAHDAVHPRPVRSPTEARMTPRLTRWRRRRVLSGGR